jgi:hypothetical protein
MYGRGRAIQFGLTGFLLRGIGKRDLNYEDSVRENTRRGIKIAFKVSQWNQL